MQITGDARVKRTRDALIPLLIRMEQEGIEQVHRNSWGPLRDELTAISVESCWSHDPTERHPPGFYLLPWPKGAWGGDGDTIVREANAFLETVPDVAAKLRASGAPERHAVVIVTVDRFQLFVAVESGNVPQVPPQLQDGVDCLWLVPLKTPPLQIVYWIQGGPWRGTTLTAEQLGVSATEF